MQKIKAIPLDNTLQMSGYNKTEIKKMRDQVRYEALIAKLKSTRKQKKLTQEALSKTSGIPRTTISKIEAGFRNPTVDTLMTLANSVGLEVKLVTKSLQR